MRKLMFALFAVVMVAGAGCLKNDVPVTSCDPLTITAPDTEIATLKHYLDSNGIVAKQDTRGFFYTIDSSASTVAGYPIRCSAISVAYVGKLTDKTTFDSVNVATPISFYLSGAIYGWQEAIPLMKANSTMKLYLPPSLAYGSQGKGKVPPNAILIFNINLLAFGN